MPILTLAILNGALVAGLLVALTAVCRIPFRLDRPGPSGRALPLPEQRRVEGRAA